MRAPLSLERTIDAPIERIWEAFTTHAGLSRWWWRHWEDTTIEIDTREGGSYLITAPGVGIELRGTILTVEAPSHLAYTRQWSDAEGSAPDEAVDIRLESEAGGTRIHIRHSGPWADDAPAESYRQGWEFVLGELELVVSA